MPNDIRVLVIDDNPDDLDLLNLELTHHGYSVELTVSGPDGLSILLSRHDSFDIVLLDHNLGPNSPTGIELLGSIKSSFPELPVVLLTGEGDNIGNLALQSGAARYFLKPIQFDELNFALRQIAHETHETRVLTILQQVSTSLSSKLEWSEIVDLITKHVTILVRADRCLIILADSQRDEIAHIAGTGYTAEELSQMSYQEIGDGISGWVLENLTTELVPDAREDTRNTGIALENAYRRGIGSIIVAPIIVDGQALGTLSAIRNASSPSYTERDKHYVELLAQQTSAGLRSVRLFETLHFLHVSNETLISEEDPDKALEIVAEQTLEAFRAKAVKLMLVDKSSAEATGLLTVGDYSIRRSREPVIRPDGVTMKVISTGLPLFFGNIRSAKRLLHPDIIKDSSIKACVCLPLCLQGECIGAMWVFFDRLRIFPKFEIEALEASARQATIAYKGIRESIRVRDLIEGAARLTSLRSDKPIIDAIAEETKQVLGCDVVTIYSFDSKSEELVYPPAFAGELISPKDVIQLDTIMRNSVGYRILEMDDPYFVENVSNDALFKDQPFATRERLATVIAMPLKTKSASSGVLFANYRKPQQFSIFEREKIKLFANQAAISIENSQIYEQAKRGKKALQICLDVGQAVNASGMNLEQVLQRIASAAAEFIDEDEVRCLSYVVHNTGSRLRPVAVVPSSKTSEVEIAMGAIRIDAYDSSKIGITGRAALLGKIQVVNDVRRDDHYIPFADDTLSQISVPIKISQQVVGVLSVEHPKLNAFSEEHQNYLTLLSENATMAFQSEVKQKRLNQFLETLNDSIRHILPTLDINEIVHICVENASKLIFGEDQIQDCSSHFGVVERQRIRFYRYHQNANVLESLKRLHPDLEVDFSDEAITNDQRIGIIGRVARQGKSEYIPDVSLDEDYVELLPDCAAQISVPVRSQEKVFGVLSVLSHDTGAFEPGDVRTVETLANYVGVVLDSKQNANALEAITEVGMKFPTFHSTDAILLELAHSAYRIMRIKPANGGDFFSTLVRKNGNNLRFMCVFPEQEQYQATLEEVFEQFDLNDQSRKTGIVGEVARSGNTVHIPSVYDSGLGDQFIYVAETKSQLSVPVIIEGSVIAILNVEHSAEGAFSDDDIEVIELLAKMASQSIQNVNSLESLTTLAKVSMIKTVRGHAINNQVTKIMQTTQGLIDSYHQLSASAHDDPSISNLLRQLESFADRLFKDQFIPDPSLDSGDGVGVHVSHSLRKATRRHSGNDRYQIELIENIDYSVTCRIDSGWLLLICEILIENAFKAMKDPLIVERRLTISATEYNGWVKISFHDTGEGIKSESLPKLFRSRIHDSDGMGIGLFMTGIILKANGGEIEAISEPGNTTITVTLPR